jgi:hypothetical protein
VQTRCHGYRSYCPATCGWCTSTGGLHVAGSSESTRSLPKLNMVLHSNRCTIGNFQGVPQCVQCHRRCTATFHPLLSLEQLAGTPTGTVTGAAATSVCVRTCTYLPLAPSSHRQPLSTPSLVAAADVSPCPNYNRYIYRNGHRRSGYFNLCLHLHLPSACTVLTQSTPVSHLTCHCC